MQKAFILPTLAFVAALQAGCSFPGVYRIDVQQGNIIDTEDLSALGPTMTRADVQDMLGTPITVSAFNPDREHYLYTFQENGGDQAAARDDLLREQPLSPPRSQPAG